MSKLRLLKKVAKAFDQLDFDIFAQSKAPQWAGNGAKFQRLKACFGLSPNPPFVAISLWVASL